MCKRCLKVRISVSSRRVDALERAPPDAFAGPSLPGGGPNHAHLPQIKGRDLYFGQAPAWLHVQALPQGASAHSQSKGRCVEAGAPGRSRWSFFAWRRSQPCSFISDQGQEPFFSGRPHPGCVCERCLKVRVRVRSRRVDALERAPPDALAGLALPGGGPNHTLSYRLKARDLYSGQAPPWLREQACLKVRVRVRSRKVDVWIAGASGRSRWSFFARRRAQPCSFTFS